MPRHVYLYYRGYDIEYAPDTFIPAHSAWLITHEDFEDFAHRCVSADECVEYIKWFEGE